MISAATIFCIFGNELLYLQLELLEIMSNFAQ